MKRSTNQVFATFLATEIVNENLLVGSVLTSRNYTHPHNDNELQK
jgi:hypothetical protein